MAMHSTTSRLVLNSEAQHLIDQVEEQGVPCSISEHSFLTLIAVSLCPSDSKGQSSLGALQSQLSQSR